jgi:hypothetical protein
MKIMSKSPTRCSVRLEGNLKLTEKEKKYLHVRKLLLFSIFQCAGHQPISVADLG